MVGVWHNKTKCFLVFQMMYRFLIWLKGLGPGPFLLPATVYLIMLIFCKYKCKIIKNLICLELGNSCMHSFIKVGSYTVYSLHGHVSVVNHLASIVICYCFSTFSAKRCPLGRDKQKSIKVSIELVQMLEL
jgi:hypothetical protein